MLTDFTTPTPISKLAYQTFQQGKSLFGAVHKLVANRAVSQLTQLFPLEEPAQNTAAGYRYEKAPKVTEAIINEVRGRLDDIYRVDWQDAELGVYPTSLLFDNPWDEFLRYYPSVWLDIPKIWDRARRKQFRDFDKDIDTSTYPKYYTQNFHHQTDGYLSDESANLYDLQVELLFNGGADPMRRRVIAPLKAALAQAFAIVPAKQIQVLDVACGTGRTLKMLRGALPQASLHGMDLSPAYLRKASQLLAGNALAGNALIQLAQGKGEELPYRDNYFHGVTCVFLFHELPGPVRQKVINEAFRVLKPGGVLVICDSIQVGDSPALTPIMEGFANTFHEPFYRDYMRDDLKRRFNNAGFIKLSEQVHYMSKYLIGNKPAN